MDFVTRFIDTYSPGLSENSRAIFKKNVYVKDYKKGDIIANIGEVASNFFFIKIWCYSQF